VQARPPAAALLLVHPGHRWPRCSGHLRIPGRSLAAGCCQPPALLALEAAVRRRPLRSAAAEWLRECQAPGSCCWAPATALPLCVHLLSQRLQGLPLAAPGCLLRRWTWRWRPAAARLAGRRARARGPPPAAPPAGQPQAAGPCQPGPESPPARPAAAAAPGGAWPKAACLAPPRPPPAPAAASHPAPAASSGELASVSSAQQQRLCNIRQCTPA
jgi:hypothetical protein